MEFFTGGFYKPTIHRVVRPPHDQSAYDRLGAFYFAMADDDVTLLPLADSPVLQQAGIKRRCSDEEAPLARACAAVEEGTDDLVWRVALTRGSENNTEGRYTTLSWQTTPFSILECWCVSDGKNLVA